jgi:RHS repeat-associated protein
VVTDSSGVVISEHHYLPFGEEVPPSSHNSVLNSSNNSHRFTGHERDSETGLDYMLARYYSSSLARFMAPDPLSGYLDKPQGMNKYTYTVNNPLKYVDPNGLDFYLLNDKGKKVKGGDACDTEGACDKKGNLIVKSEALEDPDSGFTGTVNENGVQITGAEGSAAEGTYTAQFIADTPAADLGGSGAFEGMSFNINGDCGGRCLASGTFTFNGTADQTRDTLTSRGAFQNWVDRKGPGQRTWNEIFVHPNSTSHRFGEGPSPHFLVPRTQGTSPTSGEFHVDKDVPGAKHFGCLMTGIGCQ